MKIIMKKKKPISDKIITKRSRSKAQNENQVKGPQWDIEQIHCHDNKALLEIHKILKDKPANTILSNLLLKDLTILEMSLNEANSTKIDELRSRVRNTMRTSKKKLKISINLADPGLLKKKVKYKTNLFFLYICVVIFHEFHVFYEFIILVFSKHVSCCHMLDDFSSFVFFFLFFSFLLFI